MTSEPLIYAADYHPLIDIEWIRQAVGAPRLSPFECMRYTDAVGPNILFDPDYYRRVYGSAIPSGMSCVEHFCRQDRDTPRNPNPLFSTLQWHETLGWAFEGPDWRPALFTTLGTEARFSREELKRHNSRTVIVNDREVGPPPTRGQDIGLFVHYDKTDGIQDYVLDYLDALIDQGVSIVFLSNSHELTDTALSSLTTRAWRIVTTDNKSYDWGLYHIGLLLLQDLNFHGHNILLMNDSVVGTMNSLTPLFEIARSGQYDITGAVDSLLHDWHIQSFFIYCSARIIDTQVWRDFWYTYRPHRDRWCIVNAQEVGFARWMSRHAVRMGAAWTYSQLLDFADNGRGSEWRQKIIANRQITNPTIEMWDLLLKCGFPFLKKSLFRTPLTADNLDDICNVVSRRQNYK